MQHYYLNLQKDKKDLSFETNVKISDGIRYTANEVFSNFENYLKNVLRSLENKEIRAKWRKINSKNQAKLLLEGKFFEVENKVGLYKITNPINEFDIDFEASLYYWVNNERKEQKISRQEFDRRVVRLDAKEKISKANWCGDSVSLQPFWNTTTERLKGISVYKNVEKTILYIEDGQKPNNDYKECNFKSYIDLKSISDIITKDYKGKIEDENNLIFSFLEDGNIPTNISFEGLKFRLEKINNSKVEDFHIQLLEMNEISNEDIFSPLRFFFDDDVIIKDGKDRIEYQKIEGSEEECILLLKKKGENSPSFPVSDLLTIVVNTYQIERQIEAISTLKTMPIGDHRNLIKLFEDKDKVGWNFPTNQQINEWNILTDENRDGCFEQRDFVRKAINTPDFAILEGPPGSGKTTVILELICQLIQRGKRILLCGSTHVAIDNVLERLIEKQPSGKSLIEQFAILPVRIGDAQRISEDVSNYQLDNFLVNNPDVEQKLLLEMSNLVCGTTIGILQHPKFKNRKGYINKKEGRDKYNYYSNEPIIPDFDYLIIDESSKTTFQEFLVPALYAKKWILVGDIMQLSPFTDRDEIVSNISHISDREGKRLVPNELQQAIFYLHQFKRCVNKNSKYILPIDRKVIKKIQEELYAGRIEVFKDKLFYAIMSNGEDFSEENFIQKHLHDITKLELAVSDIILIEKNLLEEALKKHLLPETHAILLSKEWNSSQQAFTHKSYTSNHPFLYQDKDKEYTDSFEIVEKINQTFKEKGWADEIAWRMDREYQLRASEKTDKKINYEDFLPRSIDIKEALDRVACMAFPSILESLVQGIKIKGKHIRTDTTISEGFKPSNLRDRRVQLKYQHRMHPDISIFPREQFYSKEGALQDLSSIEQKRQWGYGKYKRRSIWVDIEGKVNKNRNEKEVSELIKHLKEFLDFAKNMNPPDGSNEWTIACLTFYRGQETLLREELRKLTKNYKSMSNFCVQGKYKVNIKLHTVDKFQGQEADIVFLSMVQNRRDGFLDSPNRLNVAVTRAKFQLVIFGSYKYFRTESRSKELNKLAELTTKY
jgi:hypothetical protein